MTFDEWVLSNEGKEALISAGGSQAEFARQAFEAGKKLAHQENSADELEVECLKQKCDTCENQVCWSRNPNC